MVRTAKLSALFLFLLASMAAIHLQSQTNAPAPSQQTGQQPANSEPATVLKATTRLVVVDVVATSRDKPVTDLEREDFTLLEDGKEQEIKVFTFQQPIPSATASVVPAAVKLPENFFTNIPRYNADNQTFNIVLLDALNTTLPHQAYVRDQMIRYLAKMPEGQPLAIYLLSTKLTLLQDFTSDPAVLKDVVKKLSGKTSPLLDNPAGGPDQELLPPGLADSGLIPDSMLQSMMQFEQERTSFQTDLRVRTTLDAMSSLARALSGYSGRKNLVWVSEAFPIGIDPNTELTGDVFAGTRNYGPQVAEASQSLIDAQVAIYPVDARGLVPSSLFDASNSGNDKFGRSMSRPGRMGTAISNESAQLQNVHGTMQDMAERTGGKAFYNRNDIDNAIRRSIEDGSTYYTLAYYPSNKDWNGKFRKIKVRVTREGVKLSYRLGYYAVDPRTFTEQNPKQQAIRFGEALSLDSPVSTGLKFQARVLAPSDHTHNKVMVDFFLDPRAISFDDQGDGLHHATVDCVVRAYTAKGKLIKTEATTIRASLKPETFTHVMQTSFPCQQLVDLPAGSYLLRLGARDDRTGLVGTANAKVAVAQASGPAAADPKAPDEKKP
jgi:VWFA-related protein